MTLTSRLFAQLIGHCLSQSTILCWLPCGISRYYYMRMAGCWDTRRVAGVELRYTAASLAFEEDIAVLSLVDLAADMAHHILSTISWIIAHDRLSLACHILANQRILVQGVLV